MKKIIIINDKNTQIKIYKDYLVVSKNKIENIVAFRYINQLYVHKDIDVAYKQWIKLGAFFKIYFINELGDIIR
jgi:hypothetical protein